MNKPKTAVTPHPFVADPEQGSDVNGRQVCAGCNLLGQPNDAHHAMPPGPDVDAGRLAAGERSDR